MKYPNRRKVWLVYPEVQKKIISVFVLAGAIGFVGIAVGAAVFSSRLFLYLGPMIENLQPEGQMQISSLWNYFWLFTVAFGFIYIGGLFFVGLIFSNQLAGPLYRITNQLTKMIESNQLKNIEIRDSDFFSNIVTRLNESIAKRNRNPNDHS